MTTRITKAMEQKLREIVQEELSKPLDLPTRSGDPWFEDEDQRLSEAFSRFIRAVAREHERSTHAILCRIKRNNLLNGGRHDH